MCTILGQSCETTISGPIASRVVIEGRLKVGYGPLYEQRAQESIATPLRCILFDFSRFPKLNFFSFVQLHHVVRAQGQGSS